MTFTQSKVYARKYILIFLVSEPAIQQVEFTEELERWLDSQQREPGINRHGFVFFFFPILKHNNALDLKIIFGTRHELFISLLKKNYVNR